MEQIRTRHLIVLGFGVTTAALITLWALGLTLSGGPKFVFFNQMY